MSDDFIPLNQSTPTGGGRWQNQGRNRNKNLHNISQNNKSQNGPRRSYNNFNKWGNNSQRSSSFASDSNSSFGPDRNNIDAYLHPSMLQDPWTQLRRKMENAQAQSK